MKHSRAVYEFDIRSADLFEPSRCFLRLRFLLFATPDLAPSTMIIVGHGDPKSTLRRAVCSRQPCRASADNQHVAGLTWSTHQFARPFRSDKVSDNFDNVLHRRLSPDIRSKCPCRTTDRVPHLSPTCEMTRRRFSVPRRKPYCPRAE